MVQHADLDHAGVTGIPDLSAHTGDTSDAHDASAISVLDTGANFTGTDVEAVLAELQDNIDGVAGGSGVSYFTRRLVSSPTGAAQTIDVNSTSYIPVFSMSFYHDWDFFPATHFWISAAAQSSAAANTITLQLTPFASPTNPVSAGGDDLVITNTLGFFSSGWIAVSDAMSGIDDLTVAVKGSSATVDLVLRFVDIAFKID